MANLLFEGLYVPSCVFFKFSPTIPYSFSYLLKAKHKTNEAEGVPTKTTLRSDHGEINRKELRRQHQAELARQKNEETARHLAGVGAGSSDNRSSSRSAFELVAYKSVNDLPSPRGEMIIQVDAKNEAILLPIYGSMVPFHVATEKSITSQSDTNQSCYVRIIFNVPGTPFSPQDANSFKNQGAIFVKEASFRSKDPRHVNEVVAAIKTLRRQVAARESERDERTTWVTQEKLVVATNRSKPVRLPDLWIRPFFVVGEEKCLVL